MAAIGGTLKVLTSVEVEEQEGKGFFSSNAEIGHYAERVISVADLAAKIEETVSAIGEAMNRAVSVAAITIDKIEISLEVTAKGEVRLIASGSLETKGAIKLTLSPRR